MLKKGGVIDMNRYDSKSFFEKRIDEGYNLVLLGCELRAYTIRDNELYVVVVCPAKIYIYDIEKDEEAKYRLRNPWGGDRMDKSVQGPRFWTVSRVYC